MSYICIVSGEVHISVSYGQEQSYQCLLDEDVTLTCTVTPLLKVVKWYHGETYLGQCSNQRDLCVPAGGGGTDSNYNFASDVSNKQFTLHINPVSPDTDAGTYKCQHEGESDSVTLEACGKFLLYFTHIFLLNVMFK